MNVFTLFGEISINHQGALKALAETSNKAKKLNDQMQQSFEKIGSFAVKCGKVVASGLAVGTAAMGALLKTSVGEFAEYEQLVGGVETLFKDSQDKVMKYANEAYKTAGLSANDYMSTVTSFSAALLQGLGGDTEKAAELSDMAITDMADNANKMGTAMSSVQDAYQGFAKQNYTMLDNLKLGYGGTQEEMARLVNESGVLGKAITVDAKTINDVSFDKIIEAIHIIQERMGITGTTAKEASETIAGSFSTFKATWTNLMTGIATDDQNIDQLINNFTTAGETLVQNVTKILPKIRRNVAHVVENLTQYVGQKIKTGWNNTVWPFIQEQMKIRFGIELPDWQTAAGKLEAEWNRNVKPLIEGFQASVGQVFDWFSKNGESVTAIVEAIAIVFAGTWFVANPLTTALLMLSAAFVVLNTDVSEASETLKNVKGFLEDVKNGIDGVEPALIAFLGSAAIVFTALKKPLVLITYIIAVLIANWEGLKNVVGLVVDKINTFFNITIPTWWNDNVIQPIIDGWNNVTSAINNAIVAAERYLGINNGSSVYIGSSGREHGSSGSGEKGFANGLYRVPYDGFPAILHKDEAVLNRMDASEWRSAKVGGMVSDTGRLEALISNMIGLMKQVVANTGAGQNIVLDSGVLVGSLSPAIDRQLGMLAYRKGRG